jgi:signal transduction histidine kinase/CheY-like chemotaxis protein
LTPTKPPLIRALVVEPAHDEFLSTLIPSGEVVVSRLAALDRDAIGQHFNSTPPDVVVARFDPAATFSIVDLVVLRPDMPIVVVAADGEVSNEELLRGGVEEVIAPEGLSARDLMRAIRQAIARRRGQTQRITHRHRLEMVGRLSGGIAHDFNNLLLVIAGETERLVEALPNTDPLRASADAIAQAASRAASLTEQLLAFGRRQVLIARQTNVSDALKEAADLLRESVGQRVTIVADLAPNLPVVQVDRARLEQVLVNLATNARDAMGGSGTLTIKTDLVEVTEEMQSGRPWLPGGTWVRLQVADTGVGIPADVMPHLFEPFFTTKDPTPGSGLGLSTVYGIVKQSGGFVWIDSEPGDGARVTILLPPAESVAAPEKAAEQNAPAQLRVLLVDDEEAVRELLTGILESNGFEITAAASAEEASEILAGARFDVLLTDVVLPGLSGPELARRLRADVPGTRVLFMSGYTGDGLLDAAELGSEVAFIQKPFGSRALIAQLRSLLAPPPRSGFSTFVAPK